MMKMRKAILAAAAAMVLATGCSSDGQQGTETASAAQETEAAETTAVSQETTAPETEQEAAQEETASKNYEDNFAVSAEDAAAFGRQVKAAVAEKDLEKLADLTAYPVYVGFPEGSVTVESREDMIALGADKIFTQELVDSVGAADENALTPSMAGFVLSDGGTANIIFNVRDGKLGIAGINY